MIFKLRLGEAQRKSHDSYKKAFESGFFFGNEMEINLFFTHFN